MPSSEGVPIDREEFDGPREEWPYSRQVRVTRSRWLKRRTIFAALEI